MLPSGSAKHGISLTRWCAKRVSQYETCQPRIAWLVGKSEAPTSGLLVGGLRLMNIRRQAVQVGGIGVENEYAHIGLCGQVQYLEQLQRKSSVQLLLA